MGTFAVKELKTSETSGFLFLSRIKRENWPEVGQQKLCYSGKKYFIEVKSLKNVKNLI